MLKIDTVNIKELGHTYCQFSSSYLCPNNFMIYGLITHDS